MNKLAHLFLTALAIAILTMLAAIAWSQPQYGIIKVMVIELKTSKPIIGSTIYLIDTRQGAITKTNGEGTIINVRPNTYAIRVTGVGYQSDTIKNITVLPDSTIRLTIALRKRLIDSTYKSPRPAPPEFGGRVTSADIERISRRIETIDTTSRVYQVYYKP